VSERRANRLLDLQWDIEQGHIDGRGAVRRLFEIAAGREDDRALVDEAIDLGVLTEGQREPTLRLLETAPDAMRGLLDDVGLSAVRAYADEQGWERPTKTMAHSRADGQERHEIAGRLGIPVEDVI
jgi:hypothetical protein